MKHIYVDNTTIIGSDNGLSPSRRQDIIWTNVGILLVEPLGTNFSEITIEIHIFLFTKTSYCKCRLQMTSISSRPQCVNCCTFLRIIRCQWYWIFLPKQGGNPQNRWIPGRNLGTWYVNCLSFVVIFSFHWFFYFRWDTRSWVVLDKIH